MRLHEHGRDNASRPGFSCSSVVALACIFMNGAALAQSATSTPSTSESSSSGDRLDEIVVTAQHRSERLQDVPIAVSSLSAAALNQQGISSTTDIAQASPSLIFNSQAGVSSPYIRGVGSDLFDPTSESAVAIYVDDVYMAAPQANLFTLAGIKQIDVLSGPQGTLFGRNATGGVIQIQTLDPTHEPRLDASLTYGNYEFVSASVYGATGVSENVSTSLSVLYENQGDGFGHNLADGSEINKEAINNISLRNKWVIDLPTDTVLRFSADYSSTNNTLSYQKPQGSFSTLAGATAPTGYPGAYNANIDQPDFIGVHTGGVSLKVDQDLGAVSLVSISAYRQSSSSQGIDQDQTVLPVLDLTWDTKFHNFSEEVRIKGRDDSTFNWMVGAFYYNARGSYDSFEIDDTLAIGFDEQETESLAGFAQATVKLPFDTNLTGGIRYTTEDQHFLFPAANMYLKQDFEEPTYRAALDHHFSPDILGYVSFNTGFNSGGYTLLAPGQAFQPEKLKSYETGLKTEWLDHTLRVNVDGFLYQYTNQQVQVTEVGHDITANAAGSRIKGFEGSFDYLPVARLKFGGAVSSLDGHYTNYPDFQPLDPGGFPIGNPINIAGHTTIRTPKFDGNLSSQYTFPTQIGEFAPNVGVQHDSGYYWSPDNRLRQPSYTILNSSVSWKPSDKPFEVRVWGKNLLDSTYYVIRGPGANPVGDLQVPAPPRTFGVTVSYHYN
jgi:iron complex outermembrane recepter protein